MSATIEHRIKKLNGPEGLSTNIIYKDGENVQRMRLIIACNIFGLERRHRTGCTEWEDVDGLPQDFSEWVYRIKPDDDGNTWVEDSTIRELWDGLVNGQTGTATL